jgi:hypothetical protein
LGNSTGGYRGNTEALRPANELRFEARWKLGQLLAKVERDREGGRPSENRPGSGQFRAYLREIGLNKNRANECERAAGGTYVPSRDTGSKPRCPGPRQRRMCAEPVTSLTPTDAPKATTRSHDATASTLADMGVSRQQSSDALMPRARAPWRQSARRQ